ncbi:MAG: nucleotidyltransferase domain-containing protein [bacterium]|nr:nucleotidyltransferase domain-containing protein [bacterium]
MIDKNMAGLKEFTDLLIKKYKQELISAILYGSVARGNAKQESDIDLVIIIEKAPSTYYKRLQRMIKIIKKIEAKYAICIKPIIFSKEEAKENRYLFLDITEDGVMLYDKDKFFNNRLLILKKRLKELGSKRIFLKDNSWYWIIKPDLKLGEVFQL